LYALLPMGRANRVNSSTSYPYKEQMLTQNVNTVRTLVNNPGGGGAYAHEETTGFAGIYP
jgi:hypothetical protein